MNKIKSLAAVLIGIAGLSVQQAKADYVFDISSGNSQIGPYTGPYIQVDVSVTSANTANITFTSLTTNGYTFLMGGMGSAAVNVNAGSWTVSNITGTQVTNGGFALFSLSNGGSGNLDGFGTLNQQINNVNGADHALNFISFTLTGGAGTNWFANSTGTNVLLANFAGALAAAHIYVFQDPALQSNGAVTTGYGANGGAVNVPDGGTTVMLLGMALGALGVVRRYLTS